MRERLADAARRVGHWLVGVELPWALITVAVYAVAVVVVAVAFPDVSNLVTTLCVLIGTLTAAIGQLIGLLRSRAPRRCPHCGWTM